MGTKFKPLSRTDFSESESSKFSGMVTTVLKFSGDESLIIWGPISWPSFWALIWCKWLKSSELGSWILAEWIVLKQLNRFWKVQSDNIVVVEFVTFLAHSSDCDSYNITWKRILGALNLITILIKMRKRRRLKFQALSINFIFTYGKICLEFPLATFSDKVLIKLPFKSLVKSQSESISCKKWKC